MTSLKTIGTDMLLEALPDAMVIVADNGDILFVNDMAAKLFGYDRDELIGTPVEVLVPERYRPGHEGYRKGFVADPQRRPMGAGLKLFARRKDGSELPVEISLAPLQAEWGLVIFSAIRDVSDRQRSEDQISVVYDALQSSLNGVIISDNEGRIAYVNPAFLRMFEYEDQREVIGRHASRLFVGDEVRTLADVEGRIVEAGGTTEEFVARRKDGTHFPVEVSCTSVADREGRSLGRMASFVDITGRREAEAEMRRLNAELARKNEELEQFLFTASHDLKTPIVTILGFVGHLRQDVARGYHAELVDSLDEIHRAGIAMRALVDDLLELGRVGRATGEPEVIVVKTLVQEVMGRYAEQFSRMGVTVEVQERMPGIRADRKRLAQVFDNLVSNALKFGCARPAACIVVGATMGSREVRFFVKDNGPGIPDAYHEKVFELFERLDTEQEGTGVGLAIVKRVVEDHGGRVWVESAPGQGATFWLAFPEELVVDAEALNA